ncbi:MAG: hypothetical protein QOF97_114 [Acidimicrobiaceae bacterium]
MQGLRMMSKVAVVAALVAVVGCSSSKSPTSASASGTGASSTTTAPSATTAAPTTTAAAAPAALGVAMNAKVGQQIIVDGKGMTVYLFEPDGASTTSQVPAGIKASWPPVTVTGTPSVGAGLDKTKAVVQAQPDGTSQLLYNGHLLYTFAGDSSAGDAAGQGLGGIWFVLSPAGAKIA